MAAWEFYGQCYTYDGTENDNVKGEGYGTDKNGIVKEHYRKGYSQEEVTGFLRKNLDSSIEFGRCRGSKRTDHGAFIQWLLGGRKVNIGGAGQDKEVFVDSFGLGIGADRLSRKDGVVDPKSEQEVESKQTELGRLKKYTKWGLTNLHAQDFDQKFVNPYVKDWPFILNSEGDPAEPFSQGLFPEDVDIDNWRLSTGGVTDVNIRPISEQVTYYQKDNSYHNNITLDLGDPKIFGRQHISISHNLEDVDTDNNHSEIVTALDDLDSKIFITGIDIIKKDTVDNITKYYYKRRKKFSIDDITPKGSGWTPTNLTWEVNGTNGINIFLESTETDFVTFTHPTKLTTDLLDDLISYNDIIPDIFDVGESVDNLDVLFVTNTSIDYDNSVFNQDKVRSKKTFIHLPTPINLPDGQSLELDVTLPLEQDKKPFFSNTVGSLSGYRNFVTQPRCYILSGHQSCIDEDISVASIDRIEDVATITTTDYHGIYSQTFSSLSVDTTNNTIQVSDISQYSIGNVVRFASDTTLPTGLLAETDYTVENIITDKIALEGVTLSDGGTGTHVITITGAVKLILKGAKEEDYNGRFKGTVIDVDKIEYMVENEPTSPATGTIVIERLTSVSGANMKKGLTERDNQNLFSPAPEVEFAEDGNIFHQTFNVNDIESEDKRVLLATVYPTSTNTFAWRLDNDPQMRLLQWSLLSLSGGNGSASHVAYNRNKEIVDEYSLIYTSSIFEESSTNKRILTTVADHPFQVGDLFKINDIDINTSTDDTINNYNVGDIYTVSEIISNTQLKFEGKDTLIDGTAVFKIKHYPFNTSLKQNPLTYNSELYHIEDDYTSRINHILANYTRVMLPKKLIPENKTDILPKEEIYTYGSYVYQASTAYHELIADFHRGRIIVEPSPENFDAGDVSNRNIPIGDINDAGDVESDRSSYEIDDGGDVVGRASYMFGTDALDYEIPYDFNHGESRVPKSFWDQDATFEFIKLNTTQLPNDLGIDYINGNAWTTKGIFVPDYVLNAEEQSDYITKDPYKNADPVFKDYFEADYFITGKERETDAGNRYLEASLRNTPNTSFEFSSGFQDRRFEVAELILIGSTVRVTTLSAHGYVDGMSVTISGADQWEYNGRFTIKVISDYEFYYLIDSHLEPTSPATGNIYSSDTPGTESNLVRILLNKNSEEVFVNDVRRSFWESAYSIKGLSERIMSDRAYFEGAGFVNEHNITGMTAFHGFHGIPFAKIFSTDGLAPSEKPLTLIDNYNAIRSDVAYEEIESTLENSLSSNLLTSKYYNEGYLKTFASINAIDLDNNEDVEEYIRSYINGYSNKMPMRFYNSVRIMINGDENATAHATDGVTESHVDRIYEYSVADYFDAYGEAPPNDFTGQYIDDNYIFNATNLLDSETVFAEDLNDTWLAIEEGDGFDENIKDLITVSGMQFLTDDTFYKNKTEKNYIRVKMKFVFSEKAGRWITLDYRQFPTSYLTPTFGNAALKAREKSVTYAETTGEELDHYVPAIQPDKFAIKQVEFSEGSRNEVIVEFDNDEEEVFNVYNRTSLMNGEVIVYERIDEDSRISAQKLTRQVITQVTDMIQIPNTNKYRLILLNNIPTDYINDVRVSTTRNTLIDQPLQGSVVDVETTIIRSEIITVPINDDQYDLLEDALLLKKDVIIYDESFSTWDEESKTYDNYIITKILDIKEEVIFPEGFDTFRISLAVELSTDFDVNNLKIAVVNPHLKYPYNASLQDSERDVVWKSVIPVDTERAYLDLHNNPYFMMRPMEINRFNMPFLSEEFPYDVNGDINPLLLPENDLSGTESYRLTKLLDPVNDINFVVPSDVNGNKSYHNKDLFMFTPHMWKVYWHIRPAVSAMLGTNIPSPTERTGGVMADPVLNSMFIHPNMDNLNYYIPSYESMYFNEYTQDWFEDSIEADAKIIGDNDRDTYVEYDAAIVDPVNDLYRECYIELDARR